MQLLLFFFLCCWFCCPISCADPLAKLVNDLTKLQNSEITFITDFSVKEKQADFISHMMELENNAIKIMEVTKTQKENHSHVNCSNIPEEHTLKQRHSEMFVIWVKMDQLNNVLDSFAATVVMCPTLIQGGAYFRDNMFIFLVSEENKEQAKEIIFKEELVKRQKNVAIVARDGKKDAFFIYNYSVYQNKVSTSRTKGISRLSDMFPIFPMNGYSFRVGSLPYANQVVADPIVNITSPDKAYTNFSGFENEMLLEASRRLGFGIEYNNPIDQEWGALASDDSRWTGMVGDIAEGRSDLIISGIISTSSRCKVFLPTTKFYSDALVFAAPLPSRYINSLTLVYPLNYEVWIAFILALLLITVVTFWYSGQQEKWFEKDLRNWSSIINAFWFAISSCVGEGITPENNPRSATSFGLRMVMMAWFIACFIASAGYSGALTGFLTTPSYEKAIETFADILKSGLPWDMVLYGEEVETYMSKTDDPVISQIWKEKRVVTYDVPGTYARLGQVVAKKQVAIEWRNELQTQSYIGYSTQNGKVLVSISKYSPWYETPLVWAFHPINPWSDRFNFKILQMLESGLIDKWNNMALIEMKRAAGHAVTVKDESNVKPLSFTDVFGVFRTVWMAEAVFLAVFIAELVYYYSYVLLKRRTKKTLRDDNEKPSFVFRYT